MCGIAGFIARDDETATVDEVRRMTNTIVHRGPDEEGISAQGRVGLGIRRPNIIDLSGGSQPIYNKDRSVAVVFNGEIYKTFPSCARSWRREGTSFLHTSRIRPPGTTVSFLFLRPVFKSEQF